MRIASEGSGVLQKACANPRWLPDVERIRRRLRKVSTPHRLDPSQQQSLLKLLEQNEVTANNDNGCVLFVQTQVCHCHEVDLEEERLALERQLRNAKRAIERLSQAVHNAEKSLETDTCDAAASTLASSQRDLDEAVKCEADLSKQLANLNAPQVGAAAGAACCRCYCAGGAQSPRVSALAQQAPPPEPKSTQLEPCRHSNPACKPFIAVFMEKWQRDMLFCNNSWQPRVVCLDATGCASVQRQGAQAEMGRRACAPAAVAAPSHPTQR